MRLELPPFQLQAKMKKILLNNERSISELQDVKIFWGRIPPAPRLTLLAPALTCEPPPSNSKYAPPSLSKLLVRANDAGLILDTSFSVSVGNACTVIMDLREVRKLKLEKILWSTKGFDFFLAG